MNPEPCTQCGSRIVWKSVSPRLPELSCQKCGNVWKMSENEFPCKLGIAEGDWEPLELKKLSESLLTNGSEWHFIKNRCTWAAYRSWQTFEDVIITTMLEDLIYWVDRARTDPRWRQSYLMYLSGKRP